MWDKIRHPCNDLIIEPHECCTLAPFAIHHSPLDFLPSLTKLNNGGGLWQHMFIHDWYCQVMVVC